MSSSSSPQHTIQPFASPKLREADQIRRYALRRKAHRDEWMRTLLRATVLHVAIALLLHVPIIPHFLETYFSISKIWTFTIGYLFLTLDFSFIVYAAFYVRHLQRDMKRNEELSAMSTMNKVNGAIGRDTLTLSPSTPTPTPTSTSKQDLTPFSGDQMNMLGLSQREVDAYKKEQERQKSAAGKGLTHQEMMMMMEESGSLQQRKSSGEERQEEREANGEKRKEQMDMVFQSSRWSQPTQAQIQTQSQLLTPMMGMVSTPSPALSSPFLATATTTTSPASVFSRQGTSPVSSPSLQGPITNERELREYLKHTRVVTPTRNHSPSLSSYQQQQQQQQQLSPPQQHRLFHSPQQRLLPSGQLMSPAHSMASASASASSPVALSTPLSVGAVPYIHSSPFTGGMGGIQNMMMPKGPMIPRMSFQYRMSPKPISTTLGSASRGTGGLVQSDAEHAVDYERRFEQGLREWNLSEDRLQQAAENLKKWLVNKLLQPLSEDLKNVNKQFKQQGFNEYDCNHELSEAPTQLTKIPAGIPTPASGQYTLRYILECSSQRDPLLQRRLALEPYLDLPIKSKRTYVVERICELAGNGYLANYKWDGGADFDGRTWNERQLPTDTDLLMHLFCTHMEELLPKDIIFHKNFRERYVLDIAKIEDSEQALRQLQNTQRSGILFIHEKQYPPHVSLRADGKDIAVLPGRNNLFFSICLFVYYHMKEFAAEDEVLSLTGLRDIFVGHT